MLFKIFVEIYYEYYMCVFASSRSPSQCAKSQNVLLDVVGVEPPCAQRWAGRTVVRGFTVLSVVNSVKVRFGSDSSELDV